jgi:hypothetical protein
MTHNQWYEIFKTKAAGYPVGACQFAIADCHRTLQMICPDNCEAESDYSVKLWAEIDAMRDRLAYLESRRAA